MQYRRLGRTGLRVSELGLGGHEYRRWLPGERNKEDFMRTQPERKRLVERAISAGVNYFDTTHAEEAESLGLALEELDRRDQVHVAIMVFKPLEKMAKNPPSKWSQILRDDVREKLRLLRTDYADILTLFSLETNYSERRLTKALEVFNRLKEEGRIGSIGASTHQLGFLARLMRRHDCFDTVMVRYNYHLQEARDVIFPLAKASEVGVVVMKPIAWPYYGIPFTRFGPVHGEEDSSAAVRSNLQWILSSPEVATVVPGTNSHAELEENLVAVTQEGKPEEKVLDRYLRAALSPRGREKLERMSKNPAIDISHYAKRALDNPA